MLLWNTPTSFPAGVFRVSRSIGSLRPTHEQPCEVEQDPSPAAARLSLRVSTIFDGLIFQRIFRFHFPFRFPHL